MKRENIEEGRKTLSTIEYLEISLKEHVSSTENRKVSNYVDLRVSDEDNAIIKNIMIKTITDELSKLHLKLQAL